MMGVNSAPQRYQAADEFQAGDFRLPAGTYYGLREWTTHHDAGGKKDGSNRYMIRLEKDACRDLLKRPDMLKVDLEVTQAVANGSLKLR